MVQTEVLMLLCDEIMSFFMKCHYRSEVDGKGIKAIKFSWLLSEPALWKNTQE